MPAVHSSARATQVPQPDGKQKIEIVLDGLRGDRSVKEVCCEHEISETLSYSWREKLLEGSREASAGKEGRASERELRRRVRELKRALGRKTYELEIAEKHARLGVSERLLGLASWSRAALPRRRWRR